jgi:hypothetical protein
MSTITFITKLLIAEITEAKNMTYNQLVNDFVVKVVAYIYIISLYVCVCVFLYRIKA